MHTDSPEFPEYMVIGEIVELDVDEFITLIEPVTTLDTVADTNGAELVCSRWLSITTEYL